MRSLSFRSLILVSVLTIAPILALANPTIGGGSDGGGDRCEIRFKAISQNIKEWLQEGGASRFDKSLLGDDQAVRNYTKEMLHALEKFNITCVGPQDDGYPVTVNGHAKECKNFVDASGLNQIVCDREKFYSGMSHPENESSQYQIVHHEFATLAKFEVPDLNDSKYSFSGEISDFLESQTIKKLAVKAAVLPALVNDLIHKKIEIQKCTCVENQRTGACMTKDRHWAFYQSLEDRQFYRLATDFGSIELPLADLNNSKNYVSDYSHETDMEGRPLTYGADHVKVAGASVEQNVATDFLLSFQHISRSYWNDQLRGESIYLREIARVHNDSIKITFRNEFKAAAKGEKNSLSSVSCDAVLK